MRNTIGIIAVITGALLAPIAVDSASAQGRGRGQGQGQSQAQSDKDKKDKKDKKEKEQKDKAKADDQKAPVVQFYFDDRDRDFVNRHYTANLPPGLAKRDGDLPPGLAKQLRRNGTLPPGLQKRIQPFPRTLLDQLRSLPTGYRYGIVDQHVVIYRIDNYQIADIILHVVR